jgi:hypothetical protein
MRLAFSAERDIENRRLPAMKKYATKFSFLGLFVIPALAFSAVAGPRPATPPGANQPPLLVTATPTTETLPAANNTATIVPALSLDIRNVSNECVVGYVLEKWFANADGKMKKEGLKSSVRLNPNGGYHCLPPNKTIHSRGKLAFPRYPSGKFATNYKITVEYVVFEDGSSWSRPESDPYARGWLDGMMQAYAAKSRSRAAH